MTIKSKAKASKEQVAKALKEVAQTFTKQQLLKSKKYINRQDALNAILKDDEKYTLTQVDKMLEDFYKGGAK